MGAVQFPMATIRDVHMGVASASSIAVAVLSVPGAVVTEFCFWGMGGVPFFQVRATAPQNSCARPWCAVCVFVGPAGGQIV